MVAIIIIVCAVAFILLAADRNTETTRWIVAILLLTGMAAFSVEWEVTIIPFIKKAFSINMQTENRLMYVNATFTSIPQYMLPYCFVMYGISFVETLKIKQKTILGLIFSIPVLYSFLLLPFKPNSWRTTTESLIYFRDLSIWCIPYILLGIILIIYSMTIEKNPRVKFQKKLTVIIALPITITCIVNHFLLRSIGISRAWRYIVPVLTVMFGFFVFFGVKYGIMGVSFKFEKQRIENTIKSISSGTEMLNHTIKNEVLKIAMSTSNIKVSSNKSIPDIEDINYNLEVIENSTTYLKDMVSRIHSFTKDISLEGSSNNLIDLLNQALKNTENYLVAKNISVVKNYQHDVFITCDRIHIIEVLTNIIKNACDALNQYGKIHISIYGNRKTINLSIRDTGHGIKKDDLQHIFEPYFSTKDRGHNFGLGLSYCYIVMNKHKGNLDIISEEGKGTTVILSFPPFRILEYDKKLPLRSDIA